MEYIFEVIIEVKVESELSYEGTKDEFQTDCNYTFLSTPNVKVIDTEWLETN